MPGRLRVLAIEGADFGFGHGLTPRVAAAVADVADRLADALVPGGAESAGPIAGHPHRKENHAS